MVGYTATRDLIPLFGLYDLLFADHGLSVGQISSLLVIWSVVSFVAEVPSGAWADTVSRRGLLVFASALYTAGFTVWVVAPSYAGFAAGFVLWGISGAIQSGTFEALLYDELASQGKSESFARLLGYANSGAMASNLVATLTAAPLFVLGGYTLVGWASVAATVVHGGFALLLPAAPRAADADETREVAGGRGLLSRYAGMLRAGVGEVSHDTVLRRGVVLSSVLVGFLAFDEYFGLLARDGGTATAAVPLLVAITVAGQVVGTAVAGRTASMRAVTMSRVVAVGAVLLCAGALLGGVAGFAAIGVGYGILGNAMIVSEARVQDAITGPARATVTSVSGLFGEITALLIYVGFAVGSTWFSVTTLVAALAVPVLLSAVLVRRWLPPVRPDTPTAG
ncbi:MULTISPECIES: MFS transporter [Rhodococcus]|uniref:MFS transporter n=1 Tax=Rhodococcus oxybenzonivorans TaxID=1990687 RepID=A0AAE4UXD3_9NOCA|nr:MULTISPECIES: MFS transporter [Rhodococcus]MDV7243024.1 MFS transporter [Rhodococcus oxybenzonivorans]MDV7264432.1 MFS transporter [Rhodococcus oxybenzonivorans]MDV7275428.1 MFS transporter [Rhodococcus oxybenzonivorans]MDV7334717.1 MFS transporter [Rhodococcus oxybenzonivorans]MDV7344871.1 MFS transporter [Rhodococcus oxybenzonivorans]